MCTQCYAEPQYRLGTINTTLVTQITAADSPALPANRRALFTLPARSHAHTDHTCTHDARPTLDFDTRALAPRGFGPGLPMLLGSLRRPPRGGSCASCAPRLPCLPIDWPPLHPASCSARRKESPYRCRLATAARCATARTSAAIHLLKAAVLHAKAREILPSTVS